MKCAACGQEMPKDSEGNDYVCLPMQVESYMVKRYAPGSYNICGDCFLDAFMVKCGVVDKVKKWFKK